MVCFQPLHVLVVVLPQVLELAVMLELAQMVYCQKIVLKEKLFTRVFSAGIPVLFVLQFWVVV